jgi:hypothetical protein
MAKLNSKKWKKIFVLQRKRLVGLTPGLNILLEAITNSK